MLKAVPPSHLGDYRSDALSFLGLLLDWAGDGGASDILPGAWRVSKVYNRMHLHSKKKKKWCTKNKHNEY